VIFHQRRPNSILRSASVFIFHAGQCCCVTRCALSRSLDWKRPFGVADVNLRMHWSQRSDITWQRSYLRRTYEHSLARDSSPLNHRYRAKRFPRSFAGKSISGECAPKNSRLPPLPRAILFFLEHTCAVCNIKRISRLLFLIDRLNVKLIVRAIAKGAFGPRKS